MVRTLGLVLGCVAMLAWAGCSVDCEICCGTGTTQDCITMEGVDKGVCDDCMFEMVQWYPDDCDCEEK